MPFRHVDMCPRMVVRFVSYSALVGALVTACRDRHQPRTSGPPATAPADSTLGQLATDSAAQSAARFAQAFYDWYKAQGDRFEIALRERPQFFAPELLAAMKADLEAQVRNPNEVVGLDWDPFLATQDPCDPYRVGEVFRRGDTILVAVKGTCSDAAPRPGPDVIAELRNVQQRWNFVDFRHAEDRGSLVHDLADLRERRSQPRREAR